MPGVTDLPVVVIHGAGGAIGGAVASAFARRGADLHLAGPRQESLDRLSHTLRDVGRGRVSTDIVDAFDAEAVDAHAAAVADAAGRIDVVMNAASIPLVQGAPLTDMQWEDVLAPVSAWVKTQYLTSRAAAVHMSARGSGTILTLSASPSTVAIGGVGGFAAACAAVEALTRTLAAELGPSGVRAVCIRAQRIVDTLGSTPDLPMPVEQFRGFLESLTTSKSLPTLEDVAGVAVFLAEGGARAMNGSVMNVTCGMSAD